MFCLQGTNRGSEGRVRQPSCRIIGFGIDRKPVAFISQIIQPAMPCVVDQQIISGPEAAPVAGKLIDNTVTIGVDQQRSFKVILMLQNISQAPGIVSGTDQRSDTGIGIIADNQRMVIAIFDIGFCQANS